MAVLEERPGLDTVEVAAALAMVSAYDDYGDGEESTVRAISLAERLGAGNRILADVFNSRGLVLGSAGRRLEALGYFRQSLDFAEAADDMAGTSMALGNLADTHLFASAREALAYTVRGEELARRAGSRYGMGIAVANAVLCMLRLGDWDAAGDAVDRALDRDALGDIESVTMGAALVWSLRGDPARARQVYRPPRTVATDEQVRAYHEFCEALIATAEGDRRASLRRAQAALAPLHPTMDPFVLAWPLAARLAHELADRAALADLLGMLEEHHVGEIPPLVRAERRLARARLVDDPALRVGAIEDALTDLRAEGSPYHLALALLDLAEAQVAAGKDPADVIAEATTIGAALGAPSVLDRAGLLEGAGP
jgi:tetratricopeptide (TPR) repeat protein